MKNKFIVFEWLDGSGKDTQLNKSIEYLKNLDKYAQIWITREPTWSTPSWREIARKLKWEWFKTWYEALNLYVQDRIEQTEIRKQMIKHSYIFSSRFDYSTFAYQVAQWLTFDEVYKAHDYNKILLPDITFIFDVNRENIEKRLKNRWWEKEFFEELDFLDKVRANYLETYEKLKNERNIYLIDANWTIEETFLQVKNILNKEII